MRLVTFDPNYTYDGNTGGDASPHSLSGRLKASVTNRNKRHMKTATPFDSYKYLSTTACCKTQETPRKKQESSVSTENKVEMLLCLAGWSFGYSLRCLRFSPVFFFFFITLALLLVASSASTPGAGSCPEIECVLPANPARCPFFSSTDANGCARCPEPRCEGRLGSPCHPAAQTAQRTCFVAVAAQLARAKRQSVCKCVQ